MNRHRIKLLIALVLFTVALAAVWTSSQADARGLTSLGASSGLIATKPGATVASGDPDIGQGYVPHPPAQKQLHRLPWGGTAIGRTSDGWVQWIGRIWATLYLRAAQ
jgi:hypothetical protein